METSYVQLTMNERREKSRSGSRVLSREKFDRNSIEIHRVFDREIYRRNDEMETVLTFVLHGGFTDALFRKWFAICRSRVRISALCHITLRFVYPTRMFSLFSNCYAKVSLVLLSFFNQGTFDQEQIHIVN